jgi:hypothetical protein
MAVRNLASMAALTRLFSLVGCDAYVDKSKYDESERQASQLRSKVFGTLRGNGSGRLLSGPRIPESSFDFPNLITKLLSCLPSSHPG